jgi:hypothetical protein
VDSVASRSLANECQVHNSKSKLVMSESWGEGNNPSKTGIAHYTSNQVSLKVISRIQIPVRDPRNLFLQVSSLNWDLSEIFG